jgi:hypothetical protein
MPEQTTVEIITMYSYQFAHKLMRKVTIKFDCAVSYKSPEKNKEFFLCLRDAD